MHDRGALDAGATHTFEPTSKNQDQQRSTDQSTIAFAG